VQKCAQYTAAKNATNEGTHTANDEPGPRNRIASKTMTARTSA
jgi:hypothetical protein